jgi:hypothetical protein
MTIIPKISYTQATTYAQAESDFRSGLLKIEISVEERSALFHAINARIYQLNEIDPQFGKPALHESIAAELNTLQSLLHKI